LEAVLELPLFLLHLGELLKEALEVRDAFLADDRVFGKQADGALKELDLKAAVVIDHAHRKVLVDREVLVELDNVRHDHLGVEFQSTEVADLVLLDRVLRVELLDGVVHVEDELVPDLLGQEDVARDLGDGREVLVVAADEGREGAHHVFGLLQALLLLLAL